MAIANVVLNTKTYTYASDQAGIITWLERSGGIPSGFSVLTASLNGPSNPSKDDAGPWRMQLNLKLPVVATVDSSCACIGSVLRYEQARVTVEIPNSGTTAERTDFGLRIKDLMADAQVQAMFASLTRPG